jgi:hypothetical protein
MISISSRASFLRVCSVLTASLSFATLAHAQAAVIAGQVTHRTKQVPLPNVAVELIGARDTVLSNGISAKDGTFAGAGFAGEVP